MVKLVKDQIIACDKPPQAILLVGGFGASTYLKECVRRAVTAEIRIMQPPNAWQAIVQGAVMKGLANSDPTNLTTVRIKDRRARKHYGIRMQVRYNKALHRHLPKKPRWSNFHGHLRITIMKWFIKRVS